MKIYYASTFVRTVSVAQDLLEITAGSARAVRILEVVIFQTSDYGDAEAEGLQVTLLRYTGAFTSGSGGATPVSTPYSSDDLPAHDASIERNNTTPASGGTAQTLLEDAMNIQMEWHWLPPPELRINVAPTDAFVVRISAPTDAFEMNCQLLFEET